MKLLRVQVRMNSVVEPLSLQLIHFRIKSKIKSRIFLVFKITKEWSAKEERRESIKKKYNKKLRWKGKKGKILEKNADFKVRVLSYMMNTRKTC